MKSEKPLNGKAYGSIPHLPGSKFGNRDDKGVDEKAARFFIKKPDNKKDLIIVTEKLDGSSTSVANVNGEIIPLTKSGYRAISSKFIQHHYFADWVFENIDKFNKLNPGERICGEWLAQAHGTRYDLNHRDPFAAFDFFIGDIRQPWKITTDYCINHGLDFAPILFWEVGQSCSIEEALDNLEESGYYGALEPAEGCVWRWERTNPQHPIMMAKYVRPEKIVGKYLESVTGKEAVWNWKPVNHNV